MQRKQVLRTSLLWAKRILFVKQNLKTKQSIKTKRITFVGPRKHGVAVEKKNPDSLKDEPHGAKRRQRVFFSDGP
jgi:hypothetical protein